MQTLFLILILTSSLGLASPGGETPLEKAQAYTLNKNRPMTCQTLATALRTEKANTPNFKTLLKSLENLSRMFYTDKAQKLYLQAESLLLTQNKSATDRLEEARQLEPGNIQILSAITWARLRDRECTIAEKTIDEALNCNPFSPELLLLKAQTLHCLGRTETLKDFLVKNGETLKSSKNAIEVIQLQLAAETKQWDEVLRKSQELLSSDANNAEILYLNLRAQKELSSVKISKEDTGRFLSLCQKDFAVMRKKYFWNPYLCSQQKEIEDLQGHL